MRKLWLRLLHKLAEIDTGHDVVMIVRLLAVAILLHVTPTIQLTVYRTTNFQIQNFLKSSKSLVIIHSVVRKKGEFSMTIVASRVVSSGPEAHEKT